MHEPEVSAEIMSLTRVQPFAVPLLARLRLSWPFPDPPDDSFIPIFVEYG